MRHETLLHLKVQRERKRTRTSAHITDYKDFVQILGHRLFSLVVVRVVVGRRQPKAMQCNRGLSDTRGEKGRTHHLLGAGRIESLSFCTKLSSEIPM